MELADMLELQGSRSNVASTTPDMFLELNNYFSAPLLADPPPTVEDFNILDWWRINLVQYPILATMAKDFLAINVASVSSERAFSNSGRIISEQRSSLSAAHASMLVLGEDWLRAKNKYNWPKKLTEPKLGPAMLSNY